MTIVQINAVNYGSTGNIMFALSDMLQEQGDRSICATGFTWHKRDRADAVLIGGLVSKAFHMYAARLFGNHGFYSKCATRRLIKKIEAWHPDVIHLHNIHGWYLNMPALFGYFKKSNISVVWTLHDCWSFTGHCPHFTMVKCDKWKTGCHDCPQYGEYPRSLVDNSKYMYRLKKKWFTGVKDLTIVTPSEWLAGLVKQSFLKDYPVRVIHNGIDLSVFKPTPSQFREKYGIGDKYLVLGVAFGWGKRKGLDVFIELAKRLDPTRYCIVLVGTDDAVDKQLPNGIISIHRTQDQTELAEIYTAADVFANPTREENYPTVNMEAIACGTPVLTFRTGGSPEILDETCGAVVPCDDVDAMEQEIIRICETRPYCEAACLEKAKSFDKDARFREYIELYEVLNGEK